MSEVDAANGTTIQSQDLSQDGSSTIANADNGAPVINAADANGNATPSKETVKDNAPPNPAPKKNDTPRKPRGPTKAQQLAILYGNPLPLKTFPLPTIIPHNPLSVLHFLYTWLSQALSPPTSHPVAPYTGIFSASLRAVHITDPVSIRALWEQGFYGKGSLSRSELSWLDREKRRIGEGASKTSEEVTRQRRAERQQVKWERARVQQEAIEAKRREEEEAKKSDIKAGKMDEVVDAVLGHTKPIIQSVEVAPTGPMQILSMPNSVADVKQLVGDVADESSTPAPSDASAPSPSELRSEDPASPSAIAPANPSSPEKNVRFSPTIESHIAPASPLLQSARANPSHAVDTTSTPPSDAEEPPLTIHDKEHLQLTPEEAFYLHYGLGILSIYPSPSSSPIPTLDLFAQFRAASYFPVQSPTDMVRPDDNFMMNYAVYHHFRSLGWVVRGGVKFGVDYLLYNRGPVFSHAEFAVIILPSYSDPYWSSTAISAGYPEGRKAYVEERMGERGKWSWLHAVNRVNAQVKKTVVLVYVDVPAPVSAEEEEKMPLHEVLGRYTVREVVLKRWVSNRSRD